MVFKTKKLVNFSIFLLVCALLIFLIVFYTKNFDDGRAEFGVTFSAKYAEELQLDWQQAYAAIVDELQPKSLRLVAYWDEIEKEKGTYNFERIDWQLDYLSGKPVDVVLAVGRRLPRWPECHTPFWLAESEETEIREHLLKYIKATIERYKSNSQIIAWQVENEPLFNWFGVCPSSDFEFLNQETDLVRSLDPSRLLIITDSGELNGWREASKPADVLGVTLYRVVWNKFIGYWDYFFVPPSFYHYKGKLTQLFQENIPVWIMELQAEPWTNDRPMVEMTLAEQQESFDLEQFKSNVDYAKRTGFDRIYFWGAEYWYWLKLQGHADIWDYAASLQAL